MRIAPRFLVDDSIGVHRSVRRIRSSIPSGDMVVKAGAANSVALVAVAAVEKGDWPKH